MLSILLRIFISGCKENTCRFRQKYAVLCSVVSILLNVILFAGKLIAGTISGSVALVGDALNNLSDAGTCLIEILGFRIASVGAGKKHPYGHGRMEWLMGLFAAILVLFMSLEMMKSSVEAIVSPQAIEVSWAIFVVLIVSIVVKAYMFFYNQRVGAKIESVTMKAKAYDCLGDMAATTTVLIATIISALTSLQVDGWCGIIVSFFIMYAGFQALNEAVNPIIGKAPNKDLIQQIEQIAKEYPEVLDVYDFMVHDYGFHRLVVSCHIGGSIDSDSKRLVQIANEISYYLSQEMGCEPSIQVELINTNPAILADISLLATRTVQDIDISIQVSSIRIAQFELSKYVNIELCMPLKLNKKEKEIKQLLEKAMKQMDEHYILLLKTTVYTFKSKHKKLA